MIREVHNPALRSQIVGKVFESDKKTVDQALSAARESLPEWAETPVSKRAEILKRIAELYQQHAAELMMLAQREAGKTLQDAIAEVREAIDFCYYYAAQAELIETETENRIHPRGVFACISPWNFPLAIFTGQVVAALVCGNAVLAKPAEQSPLMAGRAIQLMHLAGVPDRVLQFLPGEGASVGAQLVRSALIDGVCFTGSTETARLIKRSMASEGNADAVLIAETGGINTMLVDSTALPEQAVHAILTSAFQSAGQRCSALRLLLLQQEIYDALLELIIAALKERVTGNPAWLKTDIGPVIDAEARDAINGYCAQQRSAGRVIFQAKLDKALQDEGFYVPATVIAVNSIDEVDREVFGPVLHVMAYQAENLDTVLVEINNQGYGLTMGLHTRVDQRVEQVVQQAKVGNLYVNRNQIGAIVGAQPFGGEGLSGSGPKAGGPLYLYKFTTQTQRPSFRQADSQVQANQVATAEVLKTSSIQVLKAADEAQQTWSQDLNRYQILDSIMKETGSVGLSNTLPDALIKLVSEPKQVLPGPTGESNQLSFLPRGLVLICAADSSAGLLYRMLCALLAGNAVIVINLSAPSAAIAVLQQIAADGRLPKGLVHFADEEDLQTLIDSGKIDLVWSEAGAADNRKLALLLAKMPGPMIPFLTDAQDWVSVFRERALCIDMTASGGNVTLLAAAEN